MYVRVYLSLSSYIENMKKKVISMLQTKVSQKEAQSCSVKKMFLEISQNSRESTCARVSFFLRNFYFVFINKHKVLQVSLYHLITNYSN